MNSHFQKDRGLAGRYRVKTAIACAGVEIRDAEHEAVAPPTAEMAPR